MEGTMNGCYYVLLMHYSAGRSIFFFWKLCVKARVPLGDVHATRFGTRLWQH